LKDISVIIPTLNEADNIYELVAEVCSVLHEKNYKYEVIFVDDNSSDSTREKISYHCIENKNIRLIHRKEKKGLASAVYDGAASAEADVIAVMDADLSHPPEFLPDIIEPIIKNQKDITVGSRYITGGSAEQWSFRRLVMSKAAKLPAAIFTDIKDPLSGFFCCSQRYSIIYCQQC
jgi:dolichol-phosphate mannosyltransferase